MAVQCPVCCLKHLLNAKTFLEESATAGMDIPQEIIQGINGLVNDLDTYIIENKIKPVS